MALDLYRKPFVPTKPKKEEKPEEKPASPVQVSYEEMLKKMLSGKGSAVGKAIGEGTKKAAAVGMNELNRVKSALEKTGSSVGKSIGSGTQTAGRNTTTPTNQPPANKSEAGRPIVMRPMVDVLTDIYKEDPKKGTDILRKGLELSRGTSLPVVHEDQNGHIQAIQIFDHSPEGMKRQRELERIYNDWLSKENQRTGNVELGSWMGQRSEAAKNALDPRNAREYIDWFTNGVFRGDYNDTNDITQMNQAGLVGYYQKLQENEKKLQQMLEENRLKIEAQGETDRTLPLLGLVDNDKTRNEWAIINGSGYTDEQKQTAMEELRRLWNVGSAANPSALTKANYFLQYGNKMFEANQNEAVMRQQAYDAMNGAGAYVRATRGMEEAELAEFDKKIDHALALIQDPHGELGIRQRSLESDLRTTQENIRLTQRQMKVYDEYNKLFTGGPENGNGEYVPENDVMDDYNYHIHGLMSGSGDPDAWMYTPTADKIYSFINGGEAWERYVASDRKVSGVLKYAEVMNSQEVAKFNEYYNAGMKDEAMAFMDGLQNSLSQRYVTQYEELRNRETARNMPVLSSVSTFLDTLAQPAEFVYNLVSKIFTNDADNPYSGNYTMTRHKNITRQQVGEDLGPIGKFFYDAAMSGADSALNMAIGKGLGLTGKALEAATLTLFSTEAFQTSMQQNLVESNGDFAFSFMEATIDSLIETATEIWSVEALMGDPTNLIQYIAKTAAAEGGEEFVGAAFGPYVKELLGRKNEWKTRADQIYHARGYTDDEGNFIKVSSYDEAARQAMREWNHDIVISTLSGAVSTGGGVFYGTAQNIAQRQQTGRAITAPTNTTEEGKTGAEQILQIAGGMKDGSLSQKYAEQIRQKIEKGGKPTNYEIGRLAQTISEETNAETRATIAEITKKTVRDQLTKNGVAETEAETYADIITKSLTGEANLNARDRRTLARDERALQVWLTYNTRTQESLDLRNEIREATTQQRDINTSLEDLTGVTAQKESVIADEVAQSIENTGSTEEAIDDLSNRRTELFSRDYADLAQEILSTDAEAKKDKNYLNDVMKIRMAAMTMNNAMPRTGLSRETAQRLYDAARAEFDAEDQKRIQNQQRVEPGKGTAIFDGAEYGTKEWNEKLKAKGINRHLRDQMRMIGEIAVRMGNRVEFINDEERPGVFGYEEGGTGTITVNIAGRHRSGLTHHMMATLAHEMTHWLEQNSLDGYNQLRQYVLDSLRAKGTNVEKLIISTIDNQNAVLGAESGEALSINGAMAEIVAKSCENLLSSQAVADELANTNPSLYNKIRNYVKDFMNRLRDAVKGLDSSLSFEARTLLTETEKIAKIWLGAREEALGRENVPVRAETFTPTEETNKIYSVEQRNETNEVPELKQNVKFSIDESATEKGTKLKNINNMFMDEINKLEDDENSPGYIRNRFAGKMPKAFEQWLNHQYPVGTEKMISKTEIKGFIDEDNKAIADGSKRIAEGWKSIKNKRTNIHDITSTKTNAKKINQSKKAVAEALFGKGKSIAVYNKNTKTTITANETLIQETYAHNPKRLASVIEKTLKNLKPLLETAHYIGSHKNYASTTGDVHYYVAAIRDNKTDRVVMFAVHDPVKQKGQKIKQSKKAYVARIYLANGNGAFATAWDPEVSQELHRTKLHEVSIGELIENVNDGRFRSYEPEKLIDRKVNFSVEQRNEKKTEGISRNPMVDDIDSMGTNPAIPSADEMITDAIDSVNSDEAYQAAVERGDLEEATRMLMEKLKNTEGIIPFMAPHWDTGGYRDIARAIKDSDPEAVETAAKEMAKHVPDNAVLIPMPSHTGKVNDSTDTMVLAKAIGDLTGRPVVAALEGVEREEGRHAAKKRGEEGASQEELGFKQVMDIPEGTFPVFIDNMVGKGVTADAAREAMGGGITLAYTKTLRSPGIVGLKNAVVTYDTNHRLIPLSQRFNVNKRDVRYSVEQGDAPQEIENDQGESMATLLPGNTVAATQYSLESYRDMGERQKMFSALKKAGYSEQQIKKWLDSLDSVANIIASDRTRYDFIADRSKKFLKDNGDVYKKTLDASTMCKKTRLYNGTFNLVQHMLPNTILMPEDLIDLFNLMKDRDLETPCGICYVQSRRRQLGPYTEEWLSKYKGEYIPTVDEVTTSDGLERLKEEHPQAYTDFVKAMNKKGVNNPKLVQQRTDYRGEIRDMRPGTIEYLKNIGGLRIQSFSDFEVVHMLDMMQAVMDMKARGLTAQAYTKVPEFAWVFGPTGIKINLSLIGKGTGLDAEGNLVFDNDEGMNFDEAMKLREAYSKNVGTILVGINDDHIIAAMGDSRIDFIIPFHKSGWSEKELGKIRTLKGYWDYTNYQNEYRWTTNENGERVLEKMESNIDPLSYWQFDKSGEENARIYLEECRKQGLVPKFRQFLTERSDGSYTLPEGTDRRSTNIREGYWKTLIDFKMYDNQGNGSRQTGVEPSFNMDEAYKILKEYDGSHRELPENREVAEEYVRRYKEAHPLDNVRRQYSMEDSPDMDVNAWMAGLTPGSLQTEDERALLQAWKDLRMKISMSIKRQLDYKAKIKRLEAAENLTPQEREDLVAVRNKLQVQEERQARLEREMAKVTSTEGFAGMMYQQNMVMRDFISGRTQDEVDATVDDMVHEVQKMAQEIATAKRELERIAAEEGVKQAETFLKKTKLGEYAKGLKKDYRSKMTESEIRSRMAEMALRITQGETVEDIIDSASELAYDLARTQAGYQGAYGDAADRLKQVTITIGQTQYEQLKAQHSSIPELRRQLAGTGVKIVYDKNLRGAGTLEDIGPGSEIHDLLPELGEDTGNMMDNLDRFLSVARSIRENVLSEMVHDFDLQDATDMIRGFALLSATEMKDNPAMVTQVRRLLGLQKADGGKAGELAERLANAQAYMQSSMEKGEQAKGLTKMLKKDVDSAINYYNKTAAVAAKEEKRKVREDLIKQLKSDHAKDLMKEQQKWQEMIEKDKKARETAQSNMRLRSMINTVAKRLNRLLTAETDLKNIPEEAKPLARQLLKMLGTHDLNGYRKVLLMDRKDINNMVNAMNAYDGRDGEFDMDKDLRWLIIAPDTDYADYDAHDRVVKDLIDIETGLLEYRTAEGQGIVSLQDRRVALDKVQKAASEIYAVIRSRQATEINGRRMMINELAMQARDDMKNSRYKGEWVGATKAVGTVKGAVVYGNMTPEYFFKNLKNKTMDLLYDLYHKAENRSGLEIRAARERMEQIAKETGFEKWDQEKKYSFQLERGGKVELTLGEMMSLYATWERELANQTETNGPEKSFHLQNGGFYVEERSEKKAGREYQQQRAHRVTENDMAEIRKAMTPEQIDYVNRVVSYLSNEMADLGNESSMRMFGIKKFNEKWYFPFEMWSGVKSVKSDAGIGGNDQNRVAHGSASRRRVNNASNALVIRDFTDVATKHINWMITYNTFAPAIETMQRVMNTKLMTGEGDDATEQNLRTAFAVAYGKDAIKYFDDFQKQINGGAVRVEKTLWDKLLSGFRKMSVAGSMSVALQQPLSYIRAAGMINPAYLAEAINPAYWRGSKAEMEKYSGVAVIKSMGRFDMNFGQSAVDYISPKRRTGKAKAAYNWTAEKLTAAPEVMDTMTWTRMWTACKLEQRALHKELGKNSEELMQLTAERFNTLMRRTQVYDSVLVKSKNMRSTNPVIRRMTSFMGEPTLTINTIADAYANRKEKGGTRHLINTLALFALGAAAQAAVKGIMGSGRTPDKKKNFEENFLYRFESYLMNEINPFSNIPGYSDLISVLKEEDINDDAYSVLTKLFKSISTLEEWLTGKEGDPYRYMEDSVGVMAQIFSRIPVKNIMRDMRAMYNWFIEKPYADRPTSPAVLKYQARDVFFTADNLTGVINTRLGEKGWETKNDAYYARIWEVTKAGDEKAAEELTEYMSLARGVSDKTIKSKVTDKAKKDETLDATEKAEYLVANSNSGGNYVMEQFASGAISREDATRLLKEADPGKSDDDIWWKLDRAEFEKETGIKPGSSAKYYRLDYAIENGSAEEIEEVKDQLIRRGASETEINKRIKSSLLTDIDDALDKGDVKAVEAAEKGLLEQGVSKTSIRNQKQSYFTSAFTEGEITRKQAEEGLRKFTDLGEDDMFWMLDKIEYQKETGRAEPKNNYYRLDDAIEANKATEISRAVNDMLQHGFTYDSVLKGIRYFKSDYLAAEGNAKVKMRDALTKAFKAAGMTAEQAKKEIDGWKKYKKSSK